MMGKFIQLTFEQVKNIIINNTRKKHLNFVLDRRNGGQTFVEYSIGGQEIYLYIESVYDRFIRDFLQGLKSDFLDTNFSFKVIMNIDHINCSKNKFCCEVVVHDISR